MQAAKSILFLTPMHSKQLEIYVVVSKQKPTFFYKDYLLYNIISCL